MSKLVKGKIRIQTIFCPWCHAPLLFVGAVPISVSSDQETCDRYDCTGPDTHTVLVMMGLG